MPLARGPLWDHFLLGKSMTMTLTPTLTTTPPANFTMCQALKVFPTFTELLFRDRNETYIDEPVRRMQRHQACTEEGRLMELLADEEAGEERVPDDGELEGSGVDFHG